MGVALATAYALGMAAFGRRDGRVCLRVGPGWVVCTPSVAIELCCARADRRDVGQA